MSQIHYGARVVCQLLDQRNTFKCWHGDQFSRACSAIWRANIGLAEGFEDMHRFHAPSECGKLVVRSSEREAIEGLEKAGYTVEKFVYECLERLDDKTIYFMAMFSLLPMDRVIEAEGEWKAEKARIADSGC